MSSEQKQVTIAEIETSIAMESATVAMQGKLRQAIFNSISEQDVSAIVKKQVEKAKNGDDAALQFVMKYVLGFGKSINLQQINVVSTDIETAARMAKGGRK